MTREEEATTVEARRSGRRRSAAERPLQAVEGEDGDGLTREDVALLVGAFEDLLTGTGDRDADALESEARQILASLERAPGPRVLQNESLELLRSWTEVWAEELDAGRTDAAASVRTLLVAELTRLKRLVADGG